MQTMASTYDKVESPVVPVSPRRKCDYRCRNTSVLPRRLKAGKERRNTLYLDNPIILNRT
jgi:hypothetical protein